MFTKVPIFMDIAINVKRAFMETEEVSFRGLYKGRPF